MKTITEFSGFTLKDAMAKKAALIAEGKSEEEAQGAINEQLKLADETKVAFYKNAVDMTSSRVDRVKRVVVATKASETEKVPEAFSEREGHFYLVEFFPDPSARPASTGYGRRDERGGRGGRGDNRGGGRGDSRGGGYGGGEGRGGRGRPEGGRPERAPRSDAPRPEGSFAAARPVDPNAPAPEKRSPRPPRGPKPPRAPRAPRPERTDRAPRGPKGAGELRLVFKGQSSTTLQGSGPAQTSEAAPASETPSA